MRPAQETLHARAAGCDQAPLVFVGGRGVELIEPVEPVLAGVEDQALVMEPVEPVEVATEQAELLFGLGVACDDCGQAVGFAGRVIGAGDQIGRVLFENAGEQRYRSLRGHGQIHLEVRDGDARHGDPVGELLLCPAQRGAQAPKACAECLDHTGSIAADPSVCC